MIHAEEIRKSNGQLQFALAALGTTNLQAKTTITDARTYQLNLSGERVLVGVATASGFIGVLLWALIRLWLFEP